MKHRRDDRCRSAVYLRAIGPLALGAIHLPTPLVLVLGGICLLSMAWYWTRLGYPDVPRARRLIRRASLACALVAVSSAMFGFGIVDPDVRPIPYVVAWAIGSLALAATIGLAIVDALVSLRLHRRDLADWKRENAQRLGEAIDEVRARRGRGRS